MSDKDALKKWNDLIPKEVKYLLHRLDKAGYEAYIVGGCVRDMYLGRIPHDWDITTSATPDEIENLFNKDHKVFDTGKEYGTIVVMHKGKPYEITTYRSDGNYSDCRRPDSVSFTKNLLNDLKRRDFTMNAMAYRPERDVGLVDPYNGTEALDAGVVHCVGKAYNRFAEDGLRIMRALRFAAQLNFDIEKTTSEAIHRKVYLLDKISKERIQNELVKILESKNCGNNVMRDYSDVMVQIIPEIKPMIGFEQNNPYHSYDVWEHTLHCMNNIPDNADIIIRLAILLHDIGKPLSYTEDENSIGHFYGHANISAEIAYKILTNLKFSNEIIEKTIQIIGIHDVVFTPTKAAVKRLLNKIGEEQFRRLLILRKCDIHGQTTYAKDDRIERIDKVEETLNWIISQKECFNLKDLAINGKDLIAMGIPEGKIIGTILNTCLSYVIDGTVENDKDQLFKIVNTFFASNPTIYSKTLQQKNKDTKGGNNND